MTKKDYIILAKAIKNCSDIDGNIKTDELVMKLCNVLQQDNFNFNSDKFIKATKRTAIVNL